LTIRRSCRSGDGLCSIVEPEHIEQFFCYLVEPSFSKTDFKSVHNQIICGRQSAGATNPTHVLHVIIAAMNDDGTRHRSQTGRDDKAAERQQRQAEALRRNLLRRKAQVRRRDGGNRAILNEAGDDDDRR
jgi:hypothetical protein